jgi:hypothetical protein
MRDSQAQSSQPNQPLGGLLPAFAELRPSLDTGDILLFAGESRFSHGIKRLTRSHWSHTALVARPRAGGALLLWEATLDTELADVATHQVAPGVNLYDLEQWIGHYGGETAIRPLQVTRTEEMRAALIRFYEQARGRPYERNRLELLRAVYDGPLGTNRRADSDCFFCSELVAEAYQRMGLLPPHPPANEYTPRDFSSERPTPLPLQLGASLGPEVLVCRGQERGST